MSNRNYRPNSIPVGRAATSSAWLDKTMSDPMSMLRMQYGRERPAKSSWSMGGSRRFKQSHAHLALPLVGGDTTILSWITSR
jgi:hypothetical protein